MTEAPGATAPFGKYLSTDLTYDERGLIPAIVQIASTGEVVMMAFMNEETVRKTLEIGQAVFWSRSRQEVWHKGATSGDYLNVVRMFTDCDQDALVVQVELAGKGVCHTGARSDYLEPDDVTPREVVLHR